MDGWEIFPERITAREEGFAALKSDISSPHTYLPRVKVLKNHLVNSACLVYLAC